MHPNDCIGKRVRVRTPHEDLIGGLRDVEDWGTSGGGNYLVLVVDQVADGRRTDRVVAVAMRHLETFELQE